MGGSGGALPPQLDVGGSGGALPPQLDLSSFFFFVVFRRRRRRRRRETDFNGYGLSAMSLVRCGMMPLIQLQELR